MPVTKINGVLFKKMVINGAINLKNNSDMIDELNVFPVPDGDTGTNMQMTMMGGVREIKELDSKSLVDITKTFSRGLLMGARGNSGVILSQFFRGVHLGLTEIKNSQATVHEFYNALKKGYEIAYKAVVDPREGTILTVVREACEKIKSKVNKIQTLEELLKAYLEEAKKSLENTPNLLPVLKEAGVVDSGGTGIVVIVEGMIQALEGKILSLNDDKNEEANKERVFGAQALEDFDIKFSYCTEFILVLDKPKDFDESFLKDPYNNLGDSLVVVSDDDLVKVHVHTNAPGVVLNIAQKYGEFKTLKIENMKFQHENIIHKDHKKEVLPMKKYGFIAVCTGDGIKETFKELGVDKIIDGGQSMNPSTHDFIQAIEEINAENIIILPNNSNIILAAEQSAELTPNKNIRVLKNSSIASGYSALMVFDPEVEIDDNITEMTNKVKQTQVGEITYAVRDTEFKQIKIKNGDFIAISKGEIITADQARIEAVKKLLNSILYKNNEIVTLFYGSDVLDDEINIVKNYIEELHQEIEIELIKGNQEIYSYIIAVE